jgi:hypothetical protein
MASGGGHNRDSLPRQRWRRCIRAADCRKSMAARMTLLLAGCSINIGVARLHPRQAYRRGARRSEEAAYQSDVGAGDFAASRNAQNNAKNRHHATMACIIAIEHVCALAAGYPLAYQTAARALAA